VAVHFCSFVNITELAKIVGLLSQR
jgi:hypothetical protein